MADPDTTTLYLRGIPRALVRGAKAAAAREGRTLGRWVSDRLARATGTAAPSGSGALESDLRWYEANKAGLERKYSGEYVAIVDDAVVDHARDFETLARRVFARFGTRPVCMPRVGRSEIRVRSPRAVVR